MKQKKLLILYSVLLLVAIATIIGVRKFHIAHILFSYDYPEIRNKGVIRIITEYNQTGYYISGDTIQGFQYELSQAISDVSGLEVHITLSNQLSESMELLADHKYDIIAQNVSINTEYKEDFLFSDPITLNRQVLVQKTDNPMFIQNQLDLAGKEIYVHQNSPAKFRLRNLEREIGNSINIIEEKTYSDEQLIVMVANGEIDYAVCDHGLAIAYQSLYPEINIDTNISFTQLQSWIVRKDAPILLDSLNVWLNKIKENGVYDEIYKRYYDHR
jgi:Predicted soluble lytic transglycosylase fused to an ABC-type amino acid-binding protein